MRSTSSFGPRRSEPHAPVANSTASVSLGSSSSEVTTSVLISAPARSARRHWAATMRRGLIWPAGGPSQTTGWDAPTRMPVDSRSRSASIHRASLPQPVPLASHSSAFGRTVANPHGECTLMPDRASMSRYRAMERAASIDQVGESLTIRVIRPSSWWLLNGPVQSVRTSGSSGPIRVTLWPPSARWRAAADPMRPRPTTVTCIVARLIRHSGTAEATAAAELERPVAEVVVAELDRMTVGSSIRSMTR